MGATERCFQFDNGSTSALTISGAPVVGIGSNSFDGSAVNCLSFALSTEPASATADQIYLGAKDSSDGTPKATLMMYLEQAVEVIGTFTPSHKLKIWINGTEYWMQLDAV
jgi:hypothetical protein